MSAAPSPGPPADRWTRRGLLAAAAAAGGGVLSACSAGRTGAAAEGSVPASTVTVTAEATPAPTVTVTEAPAPAPVPTLPERPAPWTAGAGEVRPACKQAAVDFLVAAMAFDDLGRDDDALAARLAPLGLGVEVAQPLVGLLPSGGPAALQVTYSQFGGITPAEDRASQMVVGDQLLLDDAGALVRRPFAADVRLSREGDRWVVTAVRPAFPEPPLPPLGPAVEALLLDPRVELPGTAAADLRSGVVAESVAVGLLALAERFRIRVHVLVSAHPVNVFATTRPSAHTVGRAVDVTALDGILVVDQARAPWRAFMEAALGAGAAQVGGPAVLEPAARSFTDLSHQDHVHVGFPADGAR